VNIQSHIGSNATILLHTIFTYTKDSHENMISAVTTLQAGQPGV